LLVAYYLYISVGRRLAMQSQVIKSKFRGALLGSLLGDCLGRPYQAHEILRDDRIIIQRYFDKMDNTSYQGPFLKFTDDTAMMKSVAKFLINNKSEPDFKFLAELFTTEFFNEPRRGYGQHVVDVFEKLKNSKYENVFKPASEQFNGSGSHGNGGAMRIAPIPLYYYDNYENMISVATEATKITHTNLLGINGALLQCIAINEAFKRDSSSSIDYKEFCSSLLSKMKAIEKSEENAPYQGKINQVLELLGKKYSDNLDDEVIHTLGNGTSISAYDSVPTAIYCFLRAQDEIPGIETDNVFRRTIQYAITLGGDTDTIACMAGAIAGAHLGDGSISKGLQQNCEQFEEIIKLADDLIEAKSRSK